MNSSLYFYDVGSYRPIPQWSNFFLELGSLLAKDIVSERRSIIGVALPTRAYASIFTAMGWLRSKIACSSDTKDYFQHLCSLPIETPVNYYDSKKQKSFKGILKGNSWNNHYGKPQLEIQITSARRVVRNIFPEQIDCVHLLNQTITLPDNQKGHSVSKESYTFAKKFLNLKHDNFSFVSSSPKCAFIGKIGVLKQELNTPFTLRNETSTNGTLQDILKVRKFVSPNEPYYSDVFRSEGNHAPEFESNYSPEIAIFDGALGFVKWRDSFPHSHWVVLLDRTESHFDEAVEILNQRYLNRSYSELSFNNLPKLPSRVELTYYQEDL